MKIQWFNTVRASYYFKEYIKIKHDKNKCNKDFLSCKLKMCLVVKPKSTGLIQVKKILLNMTKY